MSSNFDISGLGGHQQICELFSQVADTRTKSYQGKHKFLVQKNGQLTAEHSKYSPNHKTLTFKEICGIADKFIETTGHSTVDLRSMRNSLQTMLKRYKKSFWRKLFQGSTIKKAEKILHSLNTKLEKITPDEHRLYKTPLDIKLNQQTRWQQISQQQDSQKDHLDFDIDESYIFPETDKPETGTIYPWYSTKSRSIKYETHRPGDGSEIGTASSQGLHRNTMEDRHLATTITFHVGGQEYTAQLNGIFDGHGGQLASSFVQKRLPAIIEEELSKMDKISELNIQNVLKTAFVQVKEEFTQYKREIHAGGPEEISKHVQYDDPRLIEYFETPSVGTTAVVQLCFQGKIWVANTGDSRGVQVSQETTRQLSADAKPGDPHFLKGIRKRGGRVTQAPRDVPRIGGGLAVGRAIGDYINPDGKEILGITPRPQIVTLEESKHAKGEYDYVVLACDGLWDVASSYQVGDAIRKMHEEGCTSAEMAAKLVSEAINAGSTDNVSVQVIKMPKKMTPLYPPD